jgi:hypothetical protein
LSHDYWIHSCQQCFSTSKARQTATELTKRFQRFCKRITITRTG